VSVENFENLYFANLNGGAADVTFTADHWNNDNAITTITSEVRDAFNGVNLNFILVLETGLDLSGLAFDANWDDTRDTITINGDNSSETIFGAADQATTINAGNGADTITGGSGDDIIVAGLSDASDFEDTVNAGAGDDTITGGYFTDILNGEAGNDRFLFLSDDNFDIIDGGDDIDTLDFASSTQISIVVDLVAESYSHRFSRYRYNFWI